MNSIIVIQLIDEEKLTSKGCRYKIIRDVDKWKKENQPPPSKYKSGTNEYFKEYYYERGGREKFSKVYAKRHRNLKWIPLFLNPFPSEIEIDYHHINNLLVVPLPRTLHRNGMNITEKHRKKCVYKIWRIYDLDVDKLLNF